MRHIDEGCHTPAYDGDDLGPLSPVAESFWHLSKLMNTHSAELLTVRGVIDEGRLKRAVSAVCARHPLTTARLVRRGLGRPVWRAAPSVSPPLQSDTLATGSTGFNLEDGRWRGPLPEVLRAYVWAGAPLDPEREPPVRFVLLWEGELSHLMIIAPHLCTDAHAGALLLSELLEEYSALEGSGERGRAYEPSRAELEPRRVTPFLRADPLSLTHLTRLERARCVTRALARMLKDIISSGDGVSDVNSWRARGRTLLTISPRDPEALRRELRVAKRSGLTAHLLFTRALINRERAQRTSGSKTLRLADLIALVPLLPKARQRALEGRFDVLVLPHMINHDLTATLSQYTGAFQGALRRLRERDALAELYRLRVYNALARLIPVRWASGLLFRCVLKTTTTTTNPGPVRAALERCGSHEVLDFINFPQLSPPARLGVIYTTFRGQLRLLILHDEAHMSHEDAERFADELWGEVMTLTRSLEAQASA